MEWVGQFWDWAWDRHANPLSWYVRPLFLVPFMYFAYRHSWRGMVGTLVALLTSMFWFPAPSNPDPRILTFLEAERTYLTEGWTVGKVGLSLLVPAAMGALGVAFWRRSLLWGLAVLNAIVVAKVMWSVLYDEAGAAVVAPAAAGLVVTDAVVVAAVLWLRSRVVARPAPERSDGPADQQPADSGADRVAAG